MKTKFIIASIALVAGLSSCKKDCFDSSGVIMSETRQLSEFNKVSITIGARVILEEGSESSITITGPSDLMSVLKTDVTGNRLEIEYDVNCVESSPSPELHIITDSFEKIDISGYANITTIDTLHSNDFTLNVSGSADGSLNLIAQQTSIDISGSCGLDFNGSSNYVDTKTSGSSEFYFYDFETNQFKLNVSGSNKSELVVNDRLDLTVSGSADVYYQGNARVFQSISGSANITHIP